ncbi:Histidine kinase-, DNA gyrase B-, and HSP90-like ATPase [Paraburkholderia fungorum]|uniref:Histidine kinase-, DNA gyrase B-, and HSP90-like ATPase n=1 Tax=Paraburkholderia fungorum TaxID=134537 RepID=A0A1H1JEM4_9BURK|nr:ATP-binding protein [Paraburkholderia fungorum]SDR48447.1 Histidine kinase-, DNA gyrase B-, and HSP90-like ATPase [Paraburkholderia fungorum]
MADLLVKHLKSRAESHSALRSLYSQWDFDEKLIPKALQTLGSLFPHYSRHDESHSKQILVNIERLLGNNINLLTATDTWMLLESAYWHDIGMVVPYADLQAAIDDPQFQEFIDAICAQPHHELHSFACTFKRNADPTLIFQGSAPLETLSKFREFMAEWFRRKHPARAEQIVRSPMSTVGINSPRTELIPARLFRLLGRICQMHGAPFEDLVSENGLPFREAGLAQDDCHPRFVACLLRMGDLLDLDDNRFCPVMQRIAGEERSKLSKAHEDKHAGMRHLRVDQEKIEVIAECDTVEGYLEAFRWFDWLKLEIQNQMMHWREIVPSRELGLLPMLGPISVRLGGNLQILRDGERPAFTVDTNKTIELLQGNNLYESKFACVRELLQNAVDATLLRIWLTNRKQANADIWATPDNLEIKALFAHASISVELVESKLEQDGAEEKSIWSLTIRDCGTGISRNDLEYMLRIGGSQSNAVRQREINQMPEWMKPSGAFGIGLQSVFMLCNEVSLRTKSIFSNEIFDVTMYSPTGPEDGLVVLRKLDDDISFSHGTTITLKFELDAFTKSWSVSNHENESIAYKLVTALDPVLDERFPYEAALLADQVKTFGKHSLIRVHGELATVNRRFEINGENFDSDEGADGTGWKFIKSAQSEVKFFYQPSLGAHPALSLLTLYRGQKFETKNLFVPNVIIGIDLMSGKAGSWLNFNRDKISSRAHDLLEKTVLASLEQVVENDLSASDGCSLLVGENRAVYSFFLKGMALSFGGKWTDLANQLNDAWLDIVLTQKGQRLRSFFTRQDWTIGVKQSAHEPQLTDCDLLVDFSPADLTLRIILTEWAKLPSRTIQAIGPQRIYDHSSIFVGPETMVAKHQRALNEQALLRNRYRLGNEPQDCYDNCALATALWQAYSTAHGNRRYLLHVNNSFECLALRPETKLPAWQLFPFVPAGKKCVLLPFLFLGAATPNGIQIETTADQIDALSRWTQSRLRETAALDEVRRWYGELAKYIDYEIMKPTIFWRRWKRARGLTDEKASR